MPVAIEKVFHSGPLAQETLVSSNLCLDYVIYLKSKNNFL